jgi:hypothetical protein
MAFDIAGARSAGYSDEEIAAHLSQQRGYDLEGALKAGYQPSEVLGFLAGAGKPAEPASSTDAGVDFTAAATDMQGQAPRAPAQQKKPGPAVKPEGSWDLNEGSWPDDRSEAAKGVASAVTGIKSMKPAASIAGSALVVSRIGERLANWDKIDRGEFVPRAEGLAYERADEAGRQRLREELLAVASKQKGFIKESAELVKRYQSEQRANRGKTADFTDIEDVKGFANWLEFNGAAGAVYLAPVMLAAAVGGAPGAFATSYALAAGEINADRVGAAIDMSSPQRFSNPDRQDAAAAGREQTIAARVAETVPQTAAFALPNAALDVVAGPVRNVLSKPLKNLTKKEVLQRAPGMAGRDIVEEGLTGAAQEGVNIAAERYAGEQDGDFATAENAKRILNAGMAEAAGGPAGSAVNVTGGLATAPRANTPSPAQPTDSEVIASVASAPSVDDAIRAAETAVERQPAAPARPEAAEAVDNIGRLLQEAMLGQPSAPSTAAQPQQPQEASDAGASTGLPPLAAGADRGGSALPAGGLDAGARIDGPVAPAVVPGDAGAVAAGDPVPSPAAGGGAATAAVEGLAKVWTGRRGDGYQSQQDAANALPTRQKVEPDLNWKIEQRGERFVLAGYERAQPITTPEGWTVSRNDSGTLMVKGDPQAIGSSLQGLGITKFATSPGGVLVGLSQADAAMQALARPTASVDTAPAAQENAAYEAAPSPTPATKAALAPAADRVGDEGGASLGDGQQAAPAAGAAQPAVPAGERADDQVSPGAVGQPPVLDRLAGSGASQEPDVPQAARQLGAGALPARDAAAPEAAVTPETPAPAGVSASEDDRFPNVEKFDKVNVGPGGFIKPRAVAPDRPTYRETSVSGLDDRMRDDRDRIPFNSFVADREELAIGQGMNRGVMLQFRPGSVSGREHAKPMTGDLTGREYATDLLAPRAVQAVTMFPADFKVTRGLTRQRLAADFERQDLPDGRLHFTRKGLPKLPPPALPPITFTANASGTVTVEGDTDTIRRVLASAGITRLVNSKKGLLVGKSDAAKAQQVLARIAVQPEAAPAAAAPEGNPFRTFLMRNGVALRLAKDFAPGTRERLAMGRTFRKDGLEMDQLAERAAEQGFIRDRADSDGLYDLITRAVSGERIAPLYGQDAQVELQARMERQRQLEQEDAVAALDSLDDNEHQALEAPDAEIPWEAIAEPSTLADGLRALGATEQEIADAEAEVARRAQGARADAQGGGGAVEAAQGAEAAGDRSQQGQAAAAKGLTAPTEQDVLSQQRRREEGERAEAARQQDQEQRARADAERGEFALTGSTRAADANPAQRDVFDGPTQARRAEPEKTLIVQHNITAENVLHVSRLGGLAVPSIAITTVDAPMENFGEITLLGDVGMATPKADTKVFGADIYSPRYPKVSYNLTDAQWKQMAERLKPHRQEGDGVSRWDLDANDLAESLVNHKPFQRMVASQRGDEDPNTIGYHQLRAAAAEFLTDIGAQERIFQGFTYSGNRRYTPHTLDTVVKILKKELRGGENFNYGVGSVRAKHTPQFKTISGIRAAKGKLVPKAQFEAIKEEVNQELFTLADRLATFHPARDSFGFTDSVTMMLGDAARMGVPRALAENGFEDVSTEAMQDIRDYLVKLRDLPTEYFEGKITRSVSLSEFRAAVVPGDVLPRVREILKSAGLALYSYEKGNEDSRARAVKEAAQATPDALFKRGGDEQPMPSGLTMEEARRQIAAMRGARAADVQPLVEEMTSGWKGGPQITVVQTAADLPGDNPADVRGLYQRGQVWVVAGAHRAGPTLKRAIARTLAHEAVAHYGLRDMLGREGWTRLMRDIQLGIRAKNKELVRIQEFVRETYVDEKGEFYLNEAQEADEIAAKAVEEAIDADGNFRPGFAFLKAVWARVAQFLRELGLGVTFTNHELQGMLVLSMRNMEAGQRTAGGAQVAVAAAREDGPMQARADQPLQVPEVIVAAKLGTLDKHPDYKAAKAGDIAAAVRLAQETVTPQLVQRVRDEIGDRQPLVLPVAAEEASGRNAIPRAAAEVLADKLGLQTATGIVQANRAHRTGKDGYYRILMPVDFAGDIAAGQDYLILDDTITQGGTLAALASHIRKGGGNVVGAVALTGFESSARIELDPTVLTTLRQKHGSLEDQFRAVAGHGFDALTNAEARYLIAQPPQRLGDRLAEAARRAGERADQGDVGQEGLGDAFDGSQQARGTTADQQQEEAAEAPPRATSPWRDATGRLQFAPGAWLYEKLGDAAGPLLSKLQLKAATPELRRALREMRVQVQKAQDTAAAVAGEAMKLSEDERAMVSDLIEQELKAGVTPPEHAVRLAAMINTSMGAQTDELVRLGMLTSESAEMWRGKYLPRFYRSKLGKQVGDAWADAVQRMLGRTKVMAGIKGKHLRGRGLFETIPETELPQWEAMGWQVRDPGYQPGLTDDGTVQVWRDFTREERDGMGEIRDAGFRFVMGYMQTQRDIALGRLFEGLAQDPDMSGKRETEAFSVQVPDGTVPGTGAKRYGKLAGRWVSKDTMSHLSQIEEAQSDAWKMYRTAMGLWKQGKTSMNPVAHVNNILSNTSMAHFAGVSYWEAHKYLAAARDFAFKAEGVKEAKDAGLFLGTLSDAELMNVLPEDLKALVRQQDSSAKKIGRTAFDVMTFFLRRPLGWAYQAEDTFFRYLIYKDARGRGMEPGDAVDYAQKFIFAYDDLPKGARMARDVWVPFFGYTYKVIPALLETALTHPIRFATPAAVLFAANAISYAVGAGEDEGDEWDEALRKYLTDEAFRARVREKEKLERELLPKWMRGTTALFTPRAIRLGMDEVTKLPVFADVSRIIPGGDVFDVSPNADGIPVPQWMMPSNPLLTTVIAMTANKDLYFGKDLVDSNDTKAEASEKRLAWLWRQASPAIAVGNYHFERGMNALAQASGGEVTWLPEWLSEDYTGIGRDGLPVQPKYAAMQTFGIKVRPLDLEMSERIETSQRQKLLRDIDSEMRRLRRLNSSGALSDKVFERERTKADEKKDRIRQGLTVDGNAKD